MEEKQAGWLPIFLKQIVDIWRVCMSQSLFWNLIHTVFYLHFSFLLFPFPPSLLHVLAAILLVVFFLLSAPCLLSPSFIHSPSSHLFFYSFFFLFKILIIGHTPELNWTKWRLWFLSSLFRLISRFTSLKWSLAWTLLHGHKQTGLMPPLPRMICWGCKSSICHPGRAGFFMCRLVPGFDA